MINLGRTTTVVALMVAALVSVAKLAAAQQTSMDLIGELGTSQVYWWARPGDVGRPVQRTNNPQYVTTSPGFRANMKLRTDGSLELDEICLGVNQNNIRPPYIYQRTAVNYEDALLLIGHAAGVPMLDPSLAAPQISSVVNAATAVYYLTQANDEQTFLLFFTAEKAVCFSYVAPEKEPGFEFGFFVLVLMQANGNLGPIATNSASPNPTCPNGAPNCSTPNTDPSKPINSGGGGGGGILPSPDIAQLIAQLLAAGAERTAQVELLLCAIEHDECRSNAVPADVLAFFGLTFSDAQQRLLSLLSA